MFEALVITLREGVEAALVLALAIAVLRRRGLERLQGSLLWGAALAVAASVVVAALATRLTYNQELAEGIAMLVGATLVLLLVWWMWTAAPHFKQEIEAGIDRAVSRDAQGRGDWFGLFLFAFAMVFREGLETAIFLSATGFNSEGLGRLLGALAGLTLAAVLGVLLVRGTIKVPLKPFFSITSAVLILIAIQLVVGGLHELSEAEVLPSSKAEMAIIGPLIKSDFLLFALTVALAAGWLLFAPGGRAAAPVASSTATAPELRLERAARSRDRARRGWTGVIALLVVGLLTTAFVLQSRIPPRAPAISLPLENGAARFVSATVEDGHLHFFEVPLPERPVRFFAIQVGDELRTCFDACEICGDQGYFEEQGAVICRNCTAPIALQTIGRTGGCNPIPLRHTREGARMVVNEADLRAVIPHLQGR
jgi:FTR1 family protein